MVHQNDDDDDVDDDVNNQKERKKENICSTLSEVSFLSVSKMNALMNITLSIEKHTHIDLFV
jgi:hypothetical protein